MTSSSKVGLLAFADRGSGGIYQYTQSMIDALRVAGVNDLVILKGSESYQTYDFDVRTLAETPSTGVADDLARAASLLLRVRRKKFLSQDAREKTADCRLLLSPIISPFLFWSRIPFIVTIHDFQERYYPEYFSRRERIRRRIVNRVLASGSSQVICESEYVKSDLVRFTGIPPSKVTVLQAPPHVMKANAVSLPTADLPERYIFYPAQFWPHKNHVKLIEAFALLSEQYPDLFLVLTGDRAAYDSRIFPLVEGMKLGSKVKCLGYVSDDLLSETYARAQAVVLPTLFESISIPVFEAFQHGVPVCCSNVLALPEQVDQAGLLFNPHQASEISDCVSKILASPALRSELIKKGRERLNQFGMSSYGAKLRDLIAGPELS